MSLAQVLSTYLNINLLVLIGFAGLGLYTFILNKLKLQLSAYNELKLHYTVLIFVLGLSILHPLLPRNKIFSPAAKVWSAQSINSFGKDYTTPGRTGYLSLPTPTGPSLLQADQVTLIWSILGLIVFLFGSVFIFRDFRFLLKTKQNSYLIKKLGAVRIFVGEDIHVPFSYWLPGQANIVIPSTLVNRREDYRMAVAHELQHHRHGDTRWVYIMWGLKLICIINPAIYFWNDWISEIQEFACDETLVDQNKVESQAYARCLVEVAQTAINHQKRVPVGATGLTFMVEGHLLKRRIEKMFSKTTNNKMGRSISIMVGLIIISIMGATAYATKGLIQDRRVNMQQAKAMAVRAQSETGLPIVVNDLVLKQLNRYIGTPEGREFMRDSLARMENYKITIGDYLEKYGVPMEIMAVPIIESGYQNLAEVRNSKMKAAGLWQFIPQTARNYGLRVDKLKDERLDVELCTDAALRYLQSNNLRFKDWHLSALAFNMGENGVQKGMNALGTRDAWELIRNGYEGDKDYLPKLIAAILIMRNPESIQ